ncbi:MAG: 2-C-methyl-D-erythritol 2,4-cyclodiphosphate synthase [Candidatus Berkiella sp.]|jgi:2-C-methyl-D-erythritol 2,4-cyclodiphosphate synthase
MIRIGHGYDIHRLESNAQKTGIILAGVEIPYEKSFVAHSDGDVLIHALIDALLGAAALGDIGQHFPDTDPKYKNADSRILLQNVLQKITQLDYRINNIDITIIAEKPKLAPHISAMRECLTTDLQVPYDNLNIKAKTNEQCDAVGHREAIVVFAVVTLLNDSLMEK